MNTPKLTVLTSLKRVTVSFAPSFKVKTQALITGGNIQHQFFEGCLVRKRLKLQTRTWSILPAPHQDFLAELKTPTLLLRFCFSLPLEVPCGCFDEGGLTAEPYCCLHARRHRVSLESYQIHHVECLQNKTYLLYIKWL